jgi:cytochrome c oxidase subunit I+III
VAGQQAAVAALAARMGRLNVARSMAGRLSATRRAAFDTTMMMWQYTVAQGLAGLALVHVFPRLAG